MNTNSSFIRTCCIKHFCTAISIVKRILTEGESAVKDYFDFLSAGGSADPISILQKAGVDLTTETPFKAAMQEFADTLEEFKKLL